MKYWKNECFSALVQVQNGSNFSEVCVNLEHSVKEIIVMVIKNLPGWYCKDQFSISYQGQFWGRTAYPVKAGLYTEDTEPAQILNFCHNLTLMNPLTAVLGSKPYTGR